MLRSAPRKRASDMSDNKNWHLDKRVPIALIATMLIQFAGIVMYVSTINSRTVENERRISVLESQKIGERLAAVESQMVDAKALLLRVEQKIDRMADRR